MREAGQAYHGAQFTINNQAETDYVVDADVCIAYYKTLWQYCGGGVGQTPAAIISFDVMLVTYGMLPLPAE